MVRGSEAESQARRARTRSGPGLKRCFGAAVLTADRVDYWIRRQMLENPLGQPAGVASELRSGETVAADLAAAPVRESTRSSVRPSRSERPARAVLACDRRAWLGALGRALECEYDALAAPVPARLAALVRQLEAQN